MEVKICALPHGPQGQRQLTGPSSLNALGLISLYYSPVFFLLFECCMDDKMGFSFLCAYNYY